MKTADEVHKFWFVEHDNEDWFGGKPEFDQQIAEGFTTTHTGVARGDAFNWRQAPLGRVCEIIVLDQFSRQLYRNDAKAFAQDTMALALAQEAVAGGHDQHLTMEERLFLYMPYMHSESPVVHEQAMILFAALGDADNLEYEKRHFETITRFGRYPKRNTALGRVSTPEEIDYIKQTEGTAF